MEFSPDPLFTGVVGGGWGFRGFAKSDRLAATLHPGQKSVLFYGSNMIRPPRALQRLQTEAFSHLRPPAPPVMPTMQRKIFVRRKASFLVPPSADGASKAPLGGSWKKGAPNATQRSGCVWERRSDGARERSHYTVWDCGRYAVRDDETERGYLKNTASVDPLSVNSVRTGATSPCTGEAFISRPRRFQSAPWRTFSLPSSLFPLLFCKTTSQ